MATLIGELAIMLIWAGIAEVFMSQYHDPVLPYSLKIYFGAFELIVLIFFLSYSGKKVRQTNNKMIEKLKSLVNQTPEWVNFSLPVASPVIRCLALLLDVLFISALSSVVGTLFSILSSIISPDMVTATIIILYFIISIGYGINMERFLNGQSIGNKVFKLKVVDEEGLQFQFNQIVIRNLLRFFD